MVNTQDLIFNLECLIDNVAEEHKVPYIKSYIRKHNNFDVAKGLNEGDAYFKGFLRKLDPEQLKILYDKVILALRQNANIGSKTYIALNNILNNAPIPNTHIPNPKKALEAASKQAYKTIGDVFSDTLRQEEERQYQMANIEAAGRGLEEREINLCGTPYGALLKNYLVMIKDEAEYKKFNEVIRRLLLQVQGENPTLSTLNLQFRLRYALAKLVLVLEQKGLVTQAINLHKEIFGSNFNHDQVAGAFINRNKPGNKKNLPLVTESIQQHMNGYWNLIKNSFNDVKKFFGLSAERSILDDSSGVISTDSNIVAQVQQTMAAIESAKLHDPEAKRRLLQRIAKVRRARQALDEDKWVGNDIGDKEKIVTDLPYSRPILVAAFKNHKEKLLIRTDKHNQTEKSYIPHVKAHM